MNPYNPYYRCQLDTLIRREFPHADYCHLSIAQLRWISVAECLRRYDLQSFQPFCFGHGCFDACSWPGTNPVDFYLYLEEVGSDPVGIGIAGRGGRDGQSGHSLNRQPGNVHTL